MTIQEEVADLDTPTGRMRTYIYLPNDSSGHSLPGLLLYSEIFQQTGPIKRSALQFASRGYVVAVPEIFHSDEPAGAVLSYSPEGADRGNQLKYDTPLKVYDDDARVVLSHLRSRPDCSGRLGVVGFCIGGHLAFRAAMNREVEATCCFYATDIHTDSLGSGKHSDSLHCIGDIQGELMMAWGRQDPHVPDEGRGLLYARLQQEKRNFTWHEFNAAHAFMRDEGARYNPAIAHLCYDLAFETLDRVLKNGVDQSR